MGIVVALQTSTVYSGGRYPLTVRRGEAWDAESPVVKANPALFSADPADAAGAVAREMEQATAAPGEKSRARRTGR